MIELPRIPAPNSVTPVQIDKGVTQRSLAGGETVRIDRMGNRFQAEFGFPVMPADVARVFVSRLQRAISEDLRIEFPLLGVSQSGGGATVVDGANPSGVTLPIKGGTPGFAVKEGYWLNVFDSQGRPYLHNVSEGASIAPDGTATLTIWPPIRTPLDDESAVEIATPTMQGLVTDISWDLMLANMIVLGFVLEERA